MARGKYHDWLTSEGLLKLEAWARDGLTDEQIAKNIGISRSTLAEWKKKYSDISNTLKKGKEVVDIEVENALLKRALGYKYVEVTKERVTELNPHTGEPESKLVVTKEVVKEVQPDVTAQIFWLKNRKPDVWRDNGVCQDSCRIKFYLHSSPIAKSSSCFLIGFRVTTSGNVQSLIFPDHLDGCLALLPS